VESIGPISAVLASEESKFGISSLGTAGPIHRYRDRAEIPRISETPPRRSANIFGSFAYHLGACTCRLFAEVEQHLVVARHVDLRAMPNGINARVRATSSSNPGLDNASSESVTWLPGIGRKMLKTMPRRIRLCSGRNERRENHYRLAAYLLQYPVAGCSLPINIPFRYVWMQSG
jgi:hypothetical protein